MSAVKLTAAQRALLLRTSRPGGGFVKGAEVRTARSLVAMGFLILEDEGCLGRDGSNVDGERWPIRVTDAGLVARAALEGGTK